MERALNKVACVGVGVIGAGWVARLLLNGVDVDVFDPSPSARATVEAVLGNAERAYAALYPGLLPERGTLRFAASLEEAVAGADWVQESVPERLDLKQRILGEIDAAAPAHVGIGSSTSGLLPSDLQAELRHPGRLVVAHPYNPVYLLPLVEIVAGARTDAAMVTRANAVYAAIGMKPVTVRREIEAFVGDRLLEAVWREALWLVKDDVASVEEIDDIIRYSFGLRWAQMGLFQTYRIAGGEAGMRHFLAQFGPALKWPWTKLMDVPDLDEALVERIAAQSDHQSGDLGVRDLERIRDDNLVAILDALAKQGGGKGWGAGALLNEARAQLGARETAPADTPRQEPLRLLEGSVSREWIDYNGHMTESRYLEVFGNTTDRVLDHIGAGSDYVAAGFSFFTVETHIMHAGELKDGERFAVTTQILAVDEKRLHLFHEMRSADRDAVVASAEQMLLHVDAKAGRAVPAGEGVRDRMAALAREHRALARPSAAGRHVGASRR